MKRIRTREACAHQDGIAVVGDAGAMELWWFTGADQGHYSVGGVESHRRKPTSHQDDKCRHEVCALLDGAPCWHDGTSLWAEEYWLPLLESCGENYTYERLECHYSYFMADD